MASSVSKSLLDPSRSCSDTKDRAASESYIAELFPHRPPMAMAEAQIAILKVIVAAQFFSSCYFKVQLFHTVTLNAIPQKNHKMAILWFFKESHLRKLWPSYDCYFEFGKSSEVQSKSQMRKLSCMPNVDPKSVRLN